MKPFRAIRNIFRRRKTKDVTEAPPVVEEELTVKDVCSASGDRLHCILTYKDNLNHMAINYGLIAVNIWVCGSLISVNKKRHRRYPGFLDFFAKFAFFTYFQVGLCFVVDCHGVSLIWCSCFGYYLRHSIMPLSKEITLPIKKPIEGTAIHKRHQLLERVVTAMNIGALMYYAYTEEPITTLAHLCAISMGMVASLF